MEQKKDWLHKWNIKKEQHSVATFKDVDKAIQEYFIVTGKNFDPIRPEPWLSDFYTPSEDQQRRESIFVTGWLGATGLLMYKLI